VFNPPVGIMFKKDRIVLLIFSRATLFFKFDIFLAHEVIAKPSGACALAWKFLKNVGLVATLLIEAEGFAITSVRIEK